MTFDERLASIMEVKKMSGYQLAMDLDVQRERVRAYLNGTRKPKPEMIVRLAEALDISSSLLDPTNFGHLVAKTSRDGFAIVERLCDLGIVEIDGKGHFDFADWLKESRVEIETLCQKYESDPAEDRERLLLEMVLQK